MNTDAQDVKKERLQLVLGTLLITGVIAAAAIVFVGGVFYMIRYGADPQNYRLFRGEPTDLRSLKGIFEDAFSLNSRGVIQLGLLVLIATPVSRVAFSLAAFLREKDWMYTLFTLIVLMVLLYSLAGRQFF